MKSLSLLLLTFFFCINLKAQVRRSPAVVVDECDLDIPTVRIASGSEFFFKQSITHKVIIHSGEDAGCSTLPKKRYSDSVFAENARNEISILFQKYPEKYSQKCTEHFKHLGATKAEIICDTPMVVSISFSKYGCEKKIEDSTQKKSYLGSADAEITYKQSGRRLEDKPVDVVQKEECARVRECIAVAKENELPELKKLSAVACQNEIAPLTIFGAPALIKDLNFNGKRIPKVDPEINDQPKKDNNNSNSVIK